MIGGVLVVALIAADAATWPREGVVLLLLLVIAAIIAATAARMTGQSRESAPPLSPSALPRPRDGAPDEHTRLDI